jgi:hypothetical protein
MMRANRESVRDAAWYRYFQISWGKIQETGLPQGFLDYCGFQPEQVAKIKA